MRTPTMLRTSGKTDWLALCICGVLSGLSVVVLLSAQVHELTEMRTVWMQLAAAALGFCGALLVSHIDYRLMLKICPILAVLAIGLVLLLKVPGMAYMPAGSDDLAWIKIGSFSLQPSELLKPVFIYTLSLHLSKVQNTINRFSTFLLLCLHGAVPTLLIMDTGDYGSALVFFFIFVVMMFAADLNRRFLLIGLGGLLVLTPAVWFMLPDYLKNRFEVAWHPELDAHGMGYQQYQGRLALSSGGTVGKGLFTEDQLVPVPECHNDFIFSYIGQTLGLVGCVVVVVALAVLLSRILLTAGYAREETGAYICVGVFGMLISQTVMNIGMVLCVIPVVGLTLPFLSAGGTSMVACYGVVGMAMSVYRFGRPPKKTKGMEKP